MTNEYDVKKMYFCKFSCPLKQKLPQYIKDNVRSNFEINIDDIVDRIDRKHMQNSLNEYDFEFTDDICEMCPIDKFISEL
jgi:hypothetical protein